MTESSVGAELKRVREERGLTLSEVSQHLKLAARQIEALEQERFEALPGGTFVRGMLRNYARLLKLEPEPLLERIADRLQAPDANRLAARYSQPVPFSDSARRSTFVYLGLSLGVLAIGAGVAFQWYREHKSAGMQLASARRAAAKPVASGTKTQAKTAEQPATELAVKLAPPKEAPARPVSEKLAAAKAPAPNPMDPAPSAPKIAAATPAPKPPPEQAKLAAASPVKAYAGVNRLVIRCEEEAWIEVKDANDRMLVSSLNPAGAERVVRARGPLTLVIGNAQHVQVLHNDKPIDLAPYTKLAIARFTLP
jgi:cytoskeleton protein RodZ